MEAYRLGMEDNSSTEFIRREDLIDAIDGTDWYRLCENKILCGANSESDSLYKIDEIIEAIKNLPKIWGEDMRIYKERCKMQRRGFCDTEYITKDGQERGVCYGYRDRANDEILDQCKKCLDFVQNVGEEERL